MIRGALIDINASATGAHEPETVARRMLFLAATAAGVVGMTESELWAVAHPRTAIAEFHVLNIGKTMVRLSVGWGDEGVYPIGKSVGLKPEDFPWCSTYGSFDALHRAAMKSLAAEVKP